MKGMLAALFGAGVIVGSVAAEPVEIPSVKSLREMHGAKFFRGISLLTTTEKPINFADRAEIATHWAREIGASGERQHDFEFDSFFTRLCRQASDSQLNKLVEIYGTLAPSDYSKSQLLVPLSNRWIRRELKQIATEHLRVENVKSKAEASPERKTLSPSLQKAEQMYSALMKVSPDADATKEQGAAIGFETNENAFFSIVQEVLAHQGKGHSSELVRYYEASDCFSVGTGSIGDLVNRASLMAYLSERQMKKAAQGALGLALESSGADEDDASFDTTVEVLRTGGFDYEMLLAGAVVDQQLNPGLGRIEALLQELATLRTDKAARLLLDLAGLISEDDRSDLVRAIGTLIADRAAPLRDDDLVDVASYGKVLPPRKISPGMRAPLLALLRQWSTSQASNDVGEALVYCLGRIDSKDVIPPLRELLNHPAHEVSAEAAVVLRAMGEKLPEQSEPHPIRFQILANGERLPPGSTVEYEIDPEPNRSAGTSSQTNADGIIEIDRDYFVDPAHPVSGVYLDNGHNVSADQPAFSVLVPPPENLDETTAVNVTLQKVDLVFTASDQNLLQRLTGVASVTLEAHADDDEHWTRHRTSQSWKGPVKGHASILLQEGAYRVEATVQGAAIWKGKVDVHGKQSVITIPLRRATDLHAAIVAPKKNARVHRRLLCNSKETDDWPGPDDTYHGLPPGNYVLHIASSEEDRETFPGNYSGPDEIDYAGRDIAVTITDNSPALIDLGEIRLDPVAHSHAAR